MQLMRLFGRPPEIGDPAPGFCLPGSDGRRYDLADFRDRQTVVLAWFPRAFTGGCTRECRSFRENGDALRDLNAAWFAVSCDSRRRNAAFARSLELDYPVLSDPWRSAALRYGVLHRPRCVPRRWTFVIDRQGVIVHIDQAVQADSHGADIVRFLQELADQPPGN